MRPRGPRAAPPGREGRHLARERFKTDVNAFRATPLWENPRSGQNAAVGFPFQPWKAGTGSGGPRPAQAPSPPPGPQRPAPASLESPHTPPVAPRGARPTFLGRVLTSQCTFRRNRYKRRFAGSPVYLGRGHVSPSFMSDSARPRKCSVSVSLILPSY